MRGKRVVAAGLLLAVAGCGTPTPSYDAAGGRGEHARVPADAFRATVVRVVDGDTFLARLDGRVLRVRLIGVDAPESVQPNAPVECFGVAAGRLLRRLLPVGSRVRGAYEPGGRRDRFGRELWDVWLGDGRFLQAVIVRAGGAEAREYLPQTRYADLLAGLESNARDARVGMYGACPDG